MKRTILMLLAFTASWTLCSAAGAAEDPLRVVTTLPDLANLVEEIGGDRVDVQSIYRGKENTHLLTAKPSHLIAFSRADVFVQVGLSLEVSFVPGLLEAARNPRVRPGAPGFVSVSDGWDAIQVPESVSRRGGDVHPQGNPHMNLDPRGGAFMARRIFEGLCAVDPTERERYEARYADWLERMEAAQARWDALRREWQGRKVVAYHQEYDYLAAYHGLEIVGRVEPKPGIPPTPNDVAKLIATMRATGTDVILTAIWSNNDTVARIAEATDAKVVELPNMCGGLPRTDSWIAMLDVVHERLARAFEISRAR